MPIIIIMDHNLVHFIRSKGLLARTLHLGVAKDFR